MKSSMALLTALVVPLTAAAAAADYPDWERLADIEVIEVITTDEDGALRETKVWFVLLGGEPFLRTNGSKWLTNLRREPNLGLRIEDREYRARAEEIDGDAIVNKVDEASRRKYGWQEAIIHPFRIKRPDILRLMPRE